MLEILTAGVAPKKPLEPKYSAFLDYMTKLNLITEDKSTPLTNKFNSTKGGHRRRVDLSLGTEGTMQGSPWQQGVPSGANIGRVVRHLCPSEAIFTQLVAEGRMVMLQPVFRSSAQVSVGLNGMTRNGYTSSNTSVAKNVVYPDFSTSPSLVYYDSVADELYSMQGSNKSGPTVWQIPA